jgi:hypothetical protein
VGIGLIQGYISAFFQRERERAGTPTTFGTLTGISINHRKFFSSSISSFTVGSWNGIIIICINMD